MPLDLLQELSFKFIVAYTVSITDFIVLNHVDNHIVMVFNKNKHLENVWYLEF